MKPGLQLRLGQSLTLTPQLRQAIRLLQLSSIELETEINAALESNPLLEEDDEATASTVDEPIPPPTDSAAPDQQATDADREDSLYDAEAFDWDDEVPRTSASGEVSDEREAESNEGEGLAEHLRWQLRLSPLSARDQAIGEAIIDALDESGYLRETNAALIPAIALLPPAGEAEIEAVRKLIQTFDPVGVAAHSLAECLLVQLRLLDPDTDGLALARRLATSELEALAKLGAARLAKALEVDDEAMDAAVALIRSLDPKPGSQYASSSVEYVAPDAYAFRRQGRWDVRLSARATPKLGINQRYEGMIGGAARSDASYLRGQLQEARWLIRSLETRADTLLRVSRAIVGRQNAFLDHGPEAMRPLVLREIADEVGLHESTVSRVTTRKYLHTPRGTFELKHFFSSSLATEDGGAASSTAIQAMIRRLIDAENPRRPLSDARLVTELKAQGVSVARRTVAKYRDAMNIPASNERQRLG